MSIIFAKVFGLYFLAVAILALIYPDRMKTLFNRAFKDDGFLFYGAILAILLGAFVISVHNIWSWSWPVLITIIGWWSLIKGYLLLIYPEGIKYFAFMQNRSDSFYRVLGVIWLALAIFLLYRTQL